MVSDGYVKQVLKDLGCTVYELDGDYHREDGPAVIWDDGSYIWYRHGWFHRNDGPAFFNAEYGNLHWYFDGKKYSFEEWLEINDEIDEDDKILLKLEWG